jgi:hypothetical protein
MTALKQIAENALEDLELAKRSLGQLGALLYAISADESLSPHVRNLIDLGWSAACDAANLASCHREEIVKDLNDCAPQTSQYENVARISLTDFASGRHASVAKRLGMTQGSLSKAIREGRAIFVTETAAGELLAVEEKAFPGQRREVEASL